MKRISILFCLTLMIGCGSGEPEKVVVDADEPLSIEVWNTMDVDTKYEFETLEHLRSSDPKLKSEAQWNRFMKEVVVPQRRIDIPTDH